MAKKNKFDYFDAFEKQAKIACDEADLLIEVIENYTSASDLEDALERAHEIENDGDILDHDVFHAVAVDFITPIDRNDVLELAQALDDVTDKIEDVIQRFYMYDVQEMHDDAREFAKLIKKSCRALNRAMGEFGNFKKSKKLRAMTIDVNDYEEQGDRLYLEATRRLYANPDSAIAVEVWSRLFDRMEKCIDAAAHCADIMASVQLKNM